MISNLELIKIALEHSHPLKVNDDNWVGDVASALVTEKGNVYYGVCVDSGSGIGFCAERSAISQMFANGETKVSKIVAIWNNNPDKDIYVLPPCGACREFMKQVCEDGLDIEVIMSETNSKKLRDLLPDHDWPENKVEIS